jgi:hypothetical protein
VFAGDCEGGVSGTCLRTLPPKDSEPPMAVGSGAAADVSWAPSSDHVLLVGNPADPVVDVRVFGTPLAVSSVAPSDSSLGGLSGYNPGISRWVGYFGSSTNDAPTARLWRAAAGTTFVLDLGGLLPLAASWSPDGKYHAVTAWDGTPSPTSAPVFVQSVEPETLGLLWTIDGVVVSQAAVSPDDLRWQP